MLQKKFLVHVQVAVETQVMMCGNEYSIYTEFAERDIDVVRTCCKRATDVQKTHEITCLLLQRGRNAAGWWCELTGRSKTQWQRSENEMQNLPLCITLVVRQ